MIIKPNDMDKFYNDKNVIQAGVFDIFKRDGFSIITPLNEAKKVTMIKFWPVAEHFFDRSEININKDEFASYVEVAIQMLAGKGNNNRKEVKKISKGLSLNVDKIAVIIFIFTLGCIPQDKLVPNTIDLNSAHALIEDLVDSIISSGEDINWLSDLKFYTVVGKILDDEALKEIDNIGVSQQFI